MQKNIDKVIVNIYYHYYHFANIIDRNRKMTTTMIENSIAPLTTTPASPPKHVPD